MRGLKTLYAVEINEFKYCEAGWLTALWYFRKPSPISISSLVRYWVRNSILSRFDLIHLGKKLKWIPTGNTNISTIWDNMMKCQVREYGLSTLNKSFMGGIPYWQNNFGGRNILVPPPTPHPSHLLSPIMSCCRTTTCTQSALGGGSYHGWSAMEQ